MGYWPPRLPHVDCFSDDPEIARRAQREDLARLRADITRANQMTTGVIGAAVLAALFIFAVAWLK